MFWNQKLDRQRASFAAQFTPDGAGFVYRRYQRGAAYRVTTAEYDAFVADFARRQRLGYRLFMVAAVVAIAGFVAIAVLSGINPKNGIFNAGLIAAMIVSVVVFAALSMRDYTAPDRELAQRTPMAGALSTEEVRNQTFGKMTWRRIGTAAATMLVVPLLALRGNPFEGWNRLWLILAGGGLVFVAVQAVRKWQFDHEN